MSPTRKRPRQPYRTWTPDELKTLRLEWHVLGARELRARLRNRNWPTIKHKAKRLGLPQGVPQGHESLARAAKRAGVHVAVLRRLCKEYKVPIRATYPTRAKVLYRHRYVAIDALNTMLAKYLTKQQQAAESLRSAAFRRDVPYNTLRAWLLAADVLRSKARGDCTGHRVPTRDVDRVVQACRALRPLYGGRLPRPFRPVLLAYLQQRSDGPSQTLATVG